MSELKVSKLKGIGATLNQVSVPPGNDLRIGSEGCIDMRNTGALQLPTGTTAQRPGSPAAGYMRYNTQTGSLEFYTGSTWTSLAGGSYVTDGLIAYLDAGNASSYSGSGSTWTSIAPAATNIGNWSMSGYTYGSAGGQPYLQFNGSANSPAYDFGSAMTMEIVMWNQTNDSFSNIFREYHRYGVGSIDEGPILLLSISIGVIKRIRGVIATIPHNLFWNAIFNIVNMLSLSEHSIMLISIFQFTCSCMLLELKNVTDCLGFLLQVICFLSDVASAHE